MSWRIGSGLRPIQWRMLTGRTTKLVVEFAIQSPDGYHRSEAPARQHPPDSASKDIEYVSALALGLAGRNRRESGVDRTSLKL